MFVNKKLLIIFCLSFIAILLIFWEIYIPVSFGKSQAIVYTIQKGIGDEEIARDLEKQKIIKSNLWFRLYTIISRQDYKLQAGSYELSKSMSIAQIVRKFVLGDVIKNNITIIEGWNSRDIGKNL